MTKGPAEILGEDQRTRADPIGFARNRLILALGPDSEMPCAAQKTARNQVEAFRAPGRRPGGGGAPFRACPSSEPGHDELVVLQAGSRWFSASFFGNLLGE